MRLNLKQAVLPQLKGAPYPTAQAVSTYVLLKSLAGYAAPEFRQHILKSNEEMQHAFQEARKLLCDSPVGEKHEVINLCKDLENQLTKNIPSDDPLSDYQDFMSLLTKLIETIWGEIELKEDVKQTLRSLANKCLRNQLDRELALFT